MKNPKKSRLAPEKKPKSARTEKPEFKQKFTIAKDDENFGDHRKNHPSCRENEKRLGTRVCTPFRGLQKKNTPDAFSYCLIAPFSVKATPFFSSSFVPQLSSDRLRLMHEQKFTLVRPPPLHLATKSWKTESAKLNFFWDFRRTSETIIYKKVLGFLN